MIVSFARVLSERLGPKLDPQELTFLGYIADGGSRMQRLVNDLLDYSRAGSRAVRVSPVPMGRALRLAMANLRFELEESKAVVIAENLPCVAADETLLVMVFQNLIGNAIKHRGESSPVIKVEAEAGEAWCIRVTDNGVGVSPELREEVFELFRRGDHRPDVPKGTGVGLSICQRVISRLGGRIWLETPPSGSGVSACFTLPAVDSMAAGLASEGDVELREVKPPKAETESYIHTPSERST
jgi:signal transduction histidine kinase